VKGDIRLTPAFNFDEVKKFVEKTVSEINVAEIQYPGYSKFHLADEGLKAEVKLQWLEDPYDPFACNMDSDGYRALKTATLEVHKKDREFSVTGSLPLVADLKKAGYDVQICGFGRMEAYHAKNEFGMLSEFHQGFDIITKVVEKLN
jgi:acetylornithine deacetylase